ncbi:hypothetical protein DVS28_b0199 (plasmid) [Euzebya pacifica]|uniref:DUF262 domain-containing protein n=1 Tax=Euzebya pacifica TaxID=1608957 RepID=A0A346Y672_9ACTN|nr:DUF262 domain-containing protein [Euzebya pacifica]AXV09969.1 hypothetical protein DVS28_b0199 [Euzebya pacifica]
MVAVALEDKFVDTSASLSRLAEQVATGELALPELQRPFVWKNVDVRDLFDSLFRGYPVGNIMTWRTRSESVRTIGTDTKEADPSLLLIDGQQRVTSIYAVLHGAEVLNKDYKSQRIRIAFNPLTGRFETSNSAIAKNAEWIPDITKAFAENAFTVVNGYVEGLKATGRDLTDTELATVQTHLSRLTDLPKFKLAVVELKEHADVEDVAEVFVRTNNGGKSLGQSDFVLTLMSVHAQKDRIALEEWVRAAHTDSPYKAARTPHNPHILPDATQLVRVVAAVAFRRAALSDVYAFLRGDDDTQTRAERFAAWSVAQEEVLSTHHWHEFLRVLDTAGYRSSRQVNSDFAVLATYAIWTHGRQRGIDRRHLQNLMARWFYAASVTGRYSGSGESTLAADLYAMTRDDVDLISATERRLAAIMTPDFFTTSLPEALDSRSWSNRALMAYEAAQVVIDAPVLFAPNDERVSHRLGPSTAAKGIERHHLFPKAYLRHQTGLSGAQWSALANRPANAALVDWVENGDISDDAPAHYWPLHADTLPHATLAAQMADHALYDGWWTDDYDTFCETRRKLMADVIHRGYQTLVDRSPVAPDVEPEDAPIVVGDGHSTPHATSVDRSHISLADLIAAELLFADETITHLRSTAPGSGTVSTDGAIILDGVRYATPSGAGATLANGNVNGWETWAVERNGTYVRLDDLRDAYLESTSLPPATD